MLRILLRASFLLVHWGSWRYTRWTARFFPMRSMISAWFSSNQSLCLLVDGPKLSTAVLYTVSRKVILTASTSCSSRMMVSSRLFKASTNDCLVGTSFSFVLFSRFGAFLPCGLVLGWTLMLSLERICWWSVQHSAPHSPHDSHIPPTSSSHNDIVDQMPVLWMGVHPGCLVASREAENGVSD